ncbi:MAG: radical SAM protein [Elusimicrobia bacterium]|nr:radical SAM protein [Elusimicrobiota bacterium]
MSRFVFVDPPSPPGFVSFKHSHGGYGEFCRESRLKVPTLDLFHAASLLLDHGFEASLVDSVLEEHSPERCVSEVAKRKPSWAILRTAVESLPHDLEIARAIKKRCGAKVAVYGPALSAEVYGAEARGAADLALAGDAPSVFLELARRGSAEGLRGRPASEEDLDALPVPRWDLVDFRRYSYVTTQTSWGCAFRCGYCSYPVTQGSKWRARSETSVVREFSALRERHGLKFVLLRDPEFTMNRARTVALCEALLEAGTPLAWGCETRLDTLDEGLMWLMARAGCMRVIFGVESLNPAALKAMGRPELGRREFKRKVAALKRNGLLSYALYVIGLPGETKASARALIDFALELDTDWASFSMATPFPGTPLAAMAKERGWISAADPRRLTTSRPSMRNECLSAAEIEKLYLEAKSRWSAHKHPKPSARLSPA